jgi:hypothetical protein
MHGGRVGIVDFGFAWNFSTSDRGFERNENVKMSGFVSSYGWEMLSCHQTHVEKSNEKRR